MPIISVPVYYYDIDNCTSSTSSVVWRTWCDIDNDTSTCTRSVHDRQYERLYTATGATWIKWTTTERAHFVSDNGYWVREQKYETGIQEEDQEEIATFTDAHNLSRAAMNATFGDRQQVEHFLLRLPPSLRDKHEEKLRATLAENEQRFIEHQEAHERHIRELKETRRLEQERKEAAQKKADILLRGYLSPEQNEEYTENKRFKVVAQSGKTYVIRHGWSGNVELLNAKGLAVARFCIHPTIQVPVEDLLLMQKIMLEANEEYLLKTANRTELRLVSPPQEEAAA